jgi:hypothetical protein
MKCKICNIEFGNNGALTIHLKNCELNEKVDKNKVIEEYLINKKSIDDISKIYDVSFNYIRTILKNLTRDKSESQLVSVKKNRLHSFESKKKISKSLLGNRNANHRGDRQSFYKDIRMDSSWEVKVAKYLDSQSIIWKYSHLRYKLSDGSFIHPDFFIFDEFDNIIEIVEVKGYFREANKIKFQKFKREYPELKVSLWDKIVLIQKKIL